MLSGEQLGAYCLSERSAGSDVAAMTTRATPDDAASPTAYVLKGTKAWITHAGHADYYTTFARTSDDGEPRAVVLRRARPTPTGLTFGDPRAEDGPALRHRARRCIFDGVLGRRRPARRAARARAWPSRCPPSTAGRLGIAAAATGLAQAALDLATSTTPGSAQQFGRPIARLPGPGVPARRHGGRRHVRARHLPARGPAQGRRSRRSRKEAAVAKLVATDAAMKVTTDAVQVLGGAGYTQDFPARALHARGEGDPDLRGHQPDPAARHQPPAAPRLTAPATPERNTLADQRVHRRPRHRWGLRPRRGHRPPARTPTARPSSSSTCPPRRASSSPPTSASTCVFVAADVRDEAQVQAAIDAAKELGDAADRRQLRRRRHARSGRRQAAARCRSRTSRTSSTSTSSARSTCCGSRPPPCSTTSRSTATAASSS